ncbi:MAG: hypothetical protein AB7K24_10730 [Gemmataceae bacterium]
MNLNRALVDNIKHHFSLKATGQLEEILRSEDRTRWSEEAFEAAREVLAERAAGRAAEPAEPVEDLPPPPPAADPYSLAFLVGMLAVTSPAFVLALRGITAAGTDWSDQPVPFGSKCAWLALETNQTPEVAAALELRSRREATWRDGIDAAYRTSIFVTPPLADWTLAAGTTLFPPARAEDFVKPLLEKLSLQFGEAQYFCTFQDVDMHLWARARKGRLLRAHGWLGQKNLTLWNVGNVTQEERDVGLLRFPLNEPPLVKRPGEKGLAPMDEACVMQLACLWSIDPTGLDAFYKEPATGLLGVPAWVEDRIMEKGSSLPIGGRFAGGSLSE